MKLDPLVWLVKLGPLVRLEPLVLQEPLVWLVKLGPLVRLEPLEPPELQVTLV